MRKEKIHYCKELPIVDNPKTQCGKKIKTGLVFTTEKEKITCRRCRKRVEKNV